MTKNKATTGNNSSIFQTQNLQVTISPVATSEIIHCGKCREFITTFQKNINDYDMFHCKNLKKINDIFSYLGYYYCDMKTKYGENYIKPTLTINVGNLDLGVTKYEDYDDLDFFIEQGFHKYLIIGEGGIGKSLFLARLFYTLVLKSIESGCKMIPIWANCDYFGRDDKTPQKWLNDMIQKKFPSLSIESFIYNQNYKVVFIIDALNSLQYIDKEDYYNKVASWAQFVEEYCELHPNVSFVISSREINELNCFDNNDEKLIYLSSFEPYKILHFIKSFVNNQDTITRLNTLIEKHSDMHFIGIPFFLKKLIETQEKNTLISNKTDIVLLYLTTLFDRGINVYGASKREEFYFGKIKLKDIEVQKISFFKVMCISAFVCQKQNKKVLNKKDIENICNELNTINIDRILSIALEENILIRNGSVYVFSHPILQEVFSALHILTSLPENYCFEDIVRFDDKAMNREVLPHLYNMQDNKEYFIDNLINKDELIYAAECVVNNGERLKNKVANSIVNSLSNLKKNISIEDINELGLSLGLIGDFRFSSKGEYIEPPLSRVTMLKNLSVAIYPVTNSEFQKFIDDGGYSNDMYWSEVNNVNWFDYDRILKKMFDFWSDIRQRFTNDENAFIDFCKEQAVDIKQSACLAWFLNIPDSDLKTMLKELYRKEKYLQPLFWNDPRYNNPSQPVVGVSYFEVNAYCNWLSYKTGKKYRLLNCSEWEAISRAIARKYVFDEDINDTNCNTVQSKINRILPVGVLYKNRTPEGIFDLNGNIFEWTDTIYKDNNDYLEKQYIVKGGSWIQGNERATSIYVGRAKAWCRNLDVGFRVCLDEGD